MLDLGECLTLARIDPHASKRGRLGMNSVRGYGQRETGLRAHPGGAVGIARRLRVASAVGRAHPNVIAPRPGRREAVLPYRPDIGRAIFAQYGGVPARAVV